MAIQFKSVGASASGALKRYFIEQEVAKRQQMLDGFAVEDRMRQRAREDMAIQRRDQMDATAEADRQRQISATASANANAAGLRNMFADRLTQGPITAAEAPTLQSMAMREGMQLPTSMQPPAPATPEKTHLVTTVDPATGQKVKRLVTETELRNGIPEPPDNDDDIKEVGGFIYQKQGGKWNRVGEARDKSSGGPAGPKPLTEGQAKTATFYARARSAADTLSQLEPQVSGGIFQQGMLSFAPNAFQSDAGQQYLQAQRMWVEAYLRKDSGAAIGKEEYNNAAAAYFPMPGDSAGTITQKVAARERITETIKAGEGGESGGNAATAPRSKYQVTVR